MREGIRKGLITRSIYPVFCVSALRDMGVRRMMEFLGNVVPFVSEMPKPENTAGEKSLPMPMGLQVYTALNHGRAPYRRSILFQSNVWNRTSRRRLD